MWESTCNLIAQTYTVDAAGNSVPVRTQRTVFCKARSITRSEFYQAEVAGLKPAAILVIPFSKDYDSEKVVAWEGKEYTVTRVYQRPDKDAVELTIEERIDNGK